MKKYLGYAVLLLLTVGSVIFSGCYQTSIKVDNFRIAVDKNSSQIVADNENNYLTLQVKIKNIDKDEGEISASDFSLKRDDEILSKNAFFGNNIVNKMDKERIDALKTIDYVLSLEVEDESGEFELFYKDTKLASLKIKG